MNIFSPTPMPEKGPIYEGRTIEQFVSPETASQRFSPGPHTSMEIKQSLATAGIDHNKVEGWPGVNLPRVATLPEICDTYLPRIQEQTKMFQRKLDGTVEGDFLATCLDMIAKHTVAAVATDGAAITETFSPELRIYTRAVDYGLEPPIYSTDEQFSSWHSFIMDNIHPSDDDGPDSRILQEAYDKFYPLSEIVE